MLLLYFGLRINSKLKSNLFKVICSFMPWFFHYCLLQLFSLLLGGNVPATSCHSFIESYRVVYWPFSSNGVSMSESTNTTIVKYWN